MTPLLTGLLDDAALFPPARMPLADAVAEHEEWRQGPYADLVGPFVAPEELLPDVPGDFPLALTVLRPERAGEVIAAAGPRLAQLEFGSGAPTEVAEAVRGQVCGIFVYVEVPVAHVTPSLCSELRSAGLRLKLRTGGLDSSAFPTEPVLASAIYAAVRAGVPTKMTAGLHHLVRRTDQETGLEMHGLGNVLLGVHAALDGADPIQIAGTLAQRDDEAVAVGLRRLHGERGREVRRVLRSVGTCSVREPLDELAALGLLPAVRA